MITKMLKTPKYFGKFMLRRCSIGVILKNRLNINENISKIQNSRNSNLNLFQYFNVVYVKVERISDARRTFVGCRPINCVWVVSYIRISMCF